MIKYILIVDVSVNFTNNTFSATEVSGIMPVNLMLSGGVFNTSVTVSVTTMPQSATGKFILCNILIKKKFYK